MSSDSSINAETIEQTKQQIRGLVREISQLSKMDMAAEEFYREFLDRVIKALAAVGGAIWILGEGRRLQMQYQVRLSDALAEGQTDDALRHFNLLRGTLASRRSRLVPPLSGSESEEAGANPTRYLLVLALITADGEPEGIVEIFQRPDGAPATQRGYALFLEQMCELASEWLKSQKLKQFSDRHSLWAQADQFARLVHESLDLRDTAYTIVNEGRRMIGCDRVSLAVRRGRKCVVEAVSGQDTVESRSNIITSLNELASKVVATGETLWYEGSTEDLPPQLEKAIHHYVEESYAKSLVVMPLRRPKTTEVRLTELRRHEASAERNESNEIIGALIVEQIETDLGRELLTQRIDLVYEHAARAMSNTVAHNSLFLLPLWRTLGKAGWVVQARNLPKTLVAVALLLALLGALFLVPVDFKLAAEGTLEPFEKEFVFVNVPGTVRDVKIKDKDPVSSQQDLVITENPELKVELTKVRGELDVAQQRLAAARDALNNRRLSEDERAKLLGEVRELNAALESLRERIGLREKQIQELVIRSPRTGMVMLSWDVERSLEGRHVEPGQVLMAVADTGGPWELELKMPERRMGHVNRAWDANHQQGLHVDYVLATDPRERREGTVKYVDQVSRVERDTGHHVVIRVDIDKTKIASELLRPGAKVHARVTCGRCSLGYRLFHEAIAWVQTKLLF